MLTVGVDVARVEDRLTAGEFPCPGCGGSLRPWGWARTRIVREIDGSVLLRPRRSRCGECGGSHVLLPVFVLLRRADAVSVIGAALALRAAGVGARGAAVVVNRPMETVRGWLRRFARRAEQVRITFTALLVDVGVDPVPPAATLSVFADAVAAVFGACVAARSRWPNIGELPVWALAAAATGGRLLAPGWS